MASQISLILVSWRNKIENQLINHMVLVIYMHMYMNLNMLYKFEEKVYILRSLKT